MSPVVSVIIPVYNVEAYIRESLESVCRQSFRDMEILVVNDGSKDNSVEIAKEVLSHHDVPYRIIEKENGGLPSARNAGLHEARGRYVCFIDSDDMISKDHLSDLVRACKRWGTHAAFAEFEPTGEKHRAGSPAEHQESTVIEREDLLNGFLVRRYKIHCCALLIEREYLCKMDLTFNEKLRYGEDIDFMWRLFPSLDKIVCTNNRTYKYLQRKNSIMTQQNIDRVETLIAEFEKTIASLKIRYPKDERIFYLLEGKSTLAFYRTFGKSSDYQTFCRLLTETDYKNRVRPALEIQDVRIRWFARSLYLSRRLFFLETKLL